MHVGRACGPDWRLPIAAGRPVDVRCRASSPALRPLPRPRCHPCRCRGAPGCPARIHMPRRPLGRLRSRRARPLAGACRQGPAAASRTDSPRSGGEAPDLAGRILARASPRGSSGRALTSSERLEPPGAHAPGGSSWDGVEAGCRTPARAPRVTPTGGPDAPIGAALGRRDQRVRWRSSSGTSQCASSSPNRCASAATYAAWSGNRRAFTAASECPATASQSRYVIVTM
jgi:hypothetical protein